MLSENKPPTLKVKLDTKVKPDSEQINKIPQTN